jgi:uncharacterized membrane protein
MQTAVRSTWLLTLCAAPAALGQATFQGLGQMAGTTGHIAWGISGDGSTVVGEMVSSANISTGFRWTKLGGFQLLPKLGSFDTNHLAFSASFDGSVIVGTGVGTQAAYEAFRWTQAGGTIGLGDIPGGFFRSEADAVSHDGAIIAGRGNYDIDPNPPYTLINVEGMRWTQATGCVGLGDLPGSIVESTMLGISGNGQVLVGYGHSAAGYEAVRWTQGTGLVSIGDLAGGPMAGFASGASIDGSVIVGSGNDGSGDRATRWTQATGMVSLGTLPGPAFGGQDFALDCSDDGSVIVGGAHILYDDPWGFGHGRAFIWDATNGMRDLRDVLIFDYGVTNLKGWQLTLAMGISADGKTIVGEGFNPQGQYEGWIATLNGSGTGPCYADCDANGTINIDDFICFQTYYALGC